MKELLELEDRPTGVILGNYNTMLGGIMALNESGLSCPQDVSLIGVDNLPMTQVLRPKLWLIVQPMETMCEKAVAMLLERVNGEQNGMPVKISFLRSHRSDGLQAPKVLSFLCTHVQKNALPAYSIPLESPVLPGSSHLNILSHVPFRYIQY